MNTVSILTTLATLPSGAVGLPLLHGVASGRIFGVVGVGNWRIGRARHEGRAV